MIDAPRLMIRRAYYPLGVMLTCVRRYAECQQKKVFSCCLIALALAAQLVDASNGPATAAQKQHEKIFYISLQPGNLDIYYFSKPGAKPRRLTTDFGLDYNATISPDGHWLVFTSERNGNPHLYVLDLKKGGDPRPLTQSEFMEDQAVISPDGKTIAFVGTRDGTADIFTLPFDPKQIQGIERANNLTHDPGGGEFRPAFSPDGHMIAFSSDRDTPVTGRPDARVREGHIYVMDSEGKHRHRLTNSHGWDGSPTWSKDGKNIFFYSTSYSASNFTSYPLRDNQSRIWVMDVNGKALRPISARNEVAFSPTLTPEGRVAYAVQTGEGEHAHWKVMSVAQDGSNERQESDTSTDYYKPVFDQVTGAMFCHGSGPLEPGIPEGPLYPGMLYLGRGPFLVHGSPRRVSLPDRELELYAVRAFSVVPNPRQGLLASTIPSGSTMMLTDISGSDIREIIHLHTKLPWQAMSWSPDGSWIAFTQGALFSPPQTEADIWKIHPDGTGAVNLTPNSPGNDGFPSFSGDGRRIAFRSGRTGNYNIYVMNSDGTGVKRLTHGQSDDNFPAFSPLNDEIAFSSDRDGELDRKTGRRTFEIYTLKVSPNGTPGELRRITYSHGQNAHPRYSPDGQWLVFTSERGGLNDEQPLLNLPIFNPQPYADLYAYRLKDGALVRLTNNRWEDGQPYWAPPTD